MAVAARWTPARKLRFVVSSRVAIPRYCLRRQ
ncbi:MAG: hypothetical protein AVDCRST_MAG18-5136, partial [uncultured Thermomicrobiales bacterium]